MEIYDRIKSRRISLGMSQQELAEKVGYAGRSAVAKAEAGERKISDIMIKKYAQALGVTPVWLLLGEDNNPKYNNIFPIQIKKYPLLGSIACGEPIYKEADRESYILSGTDITADFCLRCEGDSMINARILDGDIVFIRKQETVEHGEIAAVAINDEATLKRVYFYPEKNTLILKAENPKFDDLIYMGEDLRNVKILGKAVAFQSDVR